MPDREQLVNHAIDFPINKFLFFDPKLSYNYEGVREKVESV
jgi:hypothetical protein